MQWQIRIASGEALPFEQTDLHQRGHAIECRLYAEDPANNFLPATGPLLRFIEPEGPGVRVDTGFTSGDEISIHYDPLVAKISAWAEDRPAAIRKMQSALRQTVLLGLTNNDQFLQDVLASPAFQAGEVFTTWVEETFGDWQPPLCALPTEVLAAAALTQFQAVQPGFVDAGRADGRRDPYNPWQIANGFRLGEGETKMRYRYQNRDQVYEITIERQAGVYQAIVDGQPYPLEVLDSQPGQMSLRLVSATGQVGPGRLFTLYWADDGSQKWISVDGCTYRLDKPASRSNRSVGDLAGGEGVRAPMPAQVRAVYASPGDRVEKGHTLLLLEAMKMEIRIKAPAAGKVTRLLAAVGQAVEKDQLLVQIGEE